MPKRFDRINCIIYLEIEKSRIAREKAAIVLNKSLVMYFCFLIVGVLGFIYKYIDSTLLNLFIILGIFVLILGALPYLIIITKEEKKIKRFLRDLKNE